MKKVIYLIIVVLGIAIFSRCGVADKTQKTICQNNFLEEICSLCEFPPVRCVEGSGSVIVLSELDGDSPASVAVNEFDKTYFIFSANYKEVSLKNYCLVKVTSEDNQLYVKFRGKSAVSAWLFKEDRIVFMKGGNVPKKLFK